MKKLLSLLAIILFSTITFASAAVVKTNSSKLEVSAKRIVFTDTGLPNGIPMFDVNNGGVFNLLGNNIKVVDESLYSSIYTSNWSGYNYDCKDLNTVSITGTIPTIAGNTKYVFQSGSYTIGSPITITANCTVFTTSGNVILNGTGGTVLIITGSQFNIIEGLKINGSGGDGIYIINSSNNTINNVEVIKGSRAIIASNSKYNLIKDSRIYSSTIGLYFTVNSNYNVVINSLSFNHSQCGIFINGGYYNTVNNSAVFNNTIRGYLVQSGTGNIFNNGFSFNNTSDGYRSVAINYYNNMYNFNNGDMTITAVNTGYGNNYSDTGWDADLKWGLSTDALVSNIGWNSGTGIAMTLSSDFAIVPYDENGTAIVDITTGSDTWKGAKIFTGFISNIVYGSEVIKQIQPVKYKSGTLFDDNYFNKDTLITSGFDFISFGNNDGNLAYFYGDRNVFEITKNGIKTDGLYIGNTLKIVNSGNRISLQYLSGTSWIEQ